MHVNHITLNWTRPALMEHYTDWLTISFISLFHRFENISTDKKSCVKLFFVVQVYIDTGKHTLLCFTKMNRCARALLHNSELLELCLKAKAAVKKTFIFNRTSDFLPLLSFSTRI